MKFSLNNLNARYLKLIRQIGQEAAQSGIKAYLVGGCVRDLLLKKRNCDIDIVVEGDAIIFSAYLSKRYNVKAHHYGQFKTATLFFPENIRIDLATARKEHYPRPGMLPVVAAGPIYDDLFRRDFTVNAMAMSIHPSSFAEMVDYFGGYEDLKNKKIRILHEKSFLDDPTRILRAVRFEQRFHFS